MENTGYKGNDSNNHYQKTLDKWINDEKAANEFIDVIGKLWFNKSIELIFLRRQLLDRGASNILHKHSYALNIIKTTALHSGFTQNCQSDARIRFSSSPY